MAAKTKSKSKKAAEVEAEVIEDEDIELEDLDTDVEDEAEAKPKGKAKKSTEEVEFGVSDLCAYLTKKTGREIKPRELRTLIRKMAREETPRVDREVIPGNRSRYDWKGGLKNPEVKRIIAAVTKGEMEADKQEKLAALKEQKAAKTAAKKKAADKGGAKGKKGKGKKVAEPEPDDDEVEEIELDEDDD